MRTYVRLAVAGTAMVLLLGLGAAGCDSGYVNRLNEPIHPPEPVDAVLPGPPVPNSPDNLLRGLEWTYNARGLLYYELLLTEDFLWNCGPTDSAGAPGTRSDELAFARNFFQGGGPDQPAAASIEFKLDPNLLVHPDPNYTAWDPLGRWHKSIRTTIVLRATLTDQSSIEILGHATFYVVRGDSAAIPEGVSRPSALPDSLRWFIRRWDDEPSSAATWCALKERYR